MTDEKTRNFESKDNLVDLDFLRVDKNSFFNCPNISIDVAVMEKTNKGIVLPLQAGWSDIGSWNSIWQISKKDNNGNTIEGSVIAKDTVNCYLRGENRFIAAIGLKNLIIVDTKEAILIS